MSNERSFFIVVMCLLLTFIFREVYTQGARRVSQGWVVPLDDLQEERRLERIALELKLTMTAPPVILEAMNRAANDSTPAPEGLPLAAASLAGDGPKPKIALMTLLDHLRGVYSWMWPMSYHTKAIYCKRMGYDLIIGSKADVEPERSSHWAKLTMMLRWLPYYDYIMWMDADTLITRFNFPLESLLVPGIDVVMARDWNNINSGVFIFRKSEFSFTFIRECLSVPLGSLVVPEWQEQSAMIWVLQRKPQYLSSIYIPPQRMLNSYPDMMAHGHEAAKWQPGDFIAHTPGCHGREHECRQAFTNTYKTAAAQWKLPPIPRVVPQSHYPRKILALPPFYSRKENKKKK